MTGPRLSTLAQHLRGSVILGIADEVRSLIAAGQDIANLTVGDFSSKQFRIPIELEDGIVDALRAGESTYPPPNGLEALRASVADFYRRRMGLDLGVENILIASGARPAIYAAYRAVVDPGERVVFGVPSWNNDYYCDILGAEQVAVECDASTSFQPTADMLRPVIRGARLLALNSPLNPTGTVFGAEQLEGICDLVLEENARRGAGERPLYLLYDQVYWMITARGVTHVNPVSLRPAIAPYVIFVDAISKAFAATGLRVGWAVAAPDVIKPMSDVIGHVGAWAPRAEQVATARLLADHASVDRYMENMRSEAATRLEAVFDGLTALQRDGLPVDCVRPQGAIYVSARFALHGSRAPHGDALSTDEDIRRYLLRAAGVAVVPFSAFGTSGDNGWFRLSIGVVSVAQIRAIMPRLGDALRSLRS
jgi:aspartate aminotransferase